MNDKIVGYIPKGDQNLNVALYALLGDFPDEDISEKKKLDMLLG